MEFALQVALSFLVGGIYVSGVVLLSEKLGSRIGAAIAGLPSTILIGILFIAIVNGASDAEAALSLVPLMFMATLAYALTFIALLRILKNGAFSAVIVATIVWLLVVLLVRQAVDLQFGIVLTIAILSLVGMHFVLKKLHSKEPKKVALPRRMYIIRFLAGGSLIAGSLAASRLLDPEWGGIIASFPVMLGLILFYIYKSQGVEFAEGFTKNLPLSYFGSLIFIVIVHQTVVSFGVVPSLMLGLLGALLYTSILLVVKKRKRRS